MRLKDIFKNSVVGLSLTVAAAPATISSFPSLYSTAASDWIKARGYPDNLLSGIHNRTVRFVDDNILGRIAVFHVERQLLWSRQTAHVESGIMKTLAQAVHTLTESADLLTAYNKGRLTMPFQDAALFNDPALITFREGLFSSAVALLFPDMSPADRRAAEMFAVAHELRHTDQRPSDGALAVLQDEGEADAYATRKVLENTGNHTVIDEIQTLRSLRGMIPDSHGGDMLHSTALYIEAAKTTAPYPDAGVILGIARTFSDLFTRMEEMDDGPDRQKRIEQVAEDMKDEIKGLSEQPEALATLNIYLKAMSLWRKELSAVSKKPALAPTPLLP